MSISSINEAILSKPVIQLATKDTMTILLVGETGVGKTSFLSLLANLFGGRGPCEFELFHDPSNESKLPSSQSQTNGALMYQLIAADGTRFRILDTPGLADTRGLDRDEEHKSSIIEAIRVQVTTVDAIVVLVNGTQERLSASTEYALTAIGSMFPRSIAGNIGFMFTQVNDALSMNFSPSSLPFGLQSAERWTIQNPVAQFVKYQELVAANLLQSELEDLQKVLFENFDKTLKTLVRFMAWVDGCTPQPTKAIQDLFDMTMAIESQVVNVFARILQQEERRVALNRLKVELQTSHQVHFASLTVTYCPSELTCSSFGIRHRL
jgi:energy-coupling factor transporter ATP-binding protein EcfA2